MTATYLILLDMKSRNRSIRLLANRMQQIPSQTHCDHDEQPNPLPTNLLREKNQQITGRSRPGQVHPQPADLLLISQGHKTYFPPIDADHDKDRTPNKENIERSQPVTIK